MNTDRFREGDTVYGILLRNGDVAVVTKEDYEAAPSCGVAVITGVDFSNKTITLSAPLPMVDKSK